MSSRDMRPVRIETDGWDKGKLTIGETDLSSEVLRVDLSIAGGRLPTVTAHMVTGKLAVEIADAEVRVDQATAAALIELGWTPPTGATWRSVDVDGEERRRERQGDQPLPTPNERPSIQAMVRADLMAREQVGVRRYGTPLQPFNGRDGLRDLYEELLDATCYVRQVVEERELSMRGGVIATVEQFAEPVLTWHPVVPSHEGDLIHSGDPVEIPLGEPWVLPGTDVSVGEFRLSTREVPEVSGG